MCDIFSVWRHQSYGVDHLLTFANLRQLGLLVEQQPGETLTVMESKVGKLVNDRTAGETGFVLHLCVPPYMQTWRIQIPLSSSSLLLFLFFVFFSRKADWCLLFSCKEEQFQSPEQKTQPGKLWSSFLFCSKINSHYRHRKPFSMFFLA